MLAFVIFFFAGFGFGYAALGMWKFTPLLFPIVLAIGAFIRDGVDAAALLKLLAAIVVMLIGIALGAMLEQRTARRETAEAG